MDHKRTTKDSTLRVRLEDELLEKLAERARANERSTAAEARLAIREHLTRSDIPTRPDVRA